MASITKIRLNGVDYKIKEEEPQIIDSELNSESVNPVENKAITQMFELQNTNLKNLEVANQSLVAQMDSLTERVQILENDTSKDYVIIITEQPVSPGTVYFGDTFSLSVEAISSLTLSYDWQYYDIDTGLWISSSNPTASTNHFTSAEVNHAATYNWRCEVSNEENEIFTKVIQVVQVDPSITITQQPENTPVKQNHEWSMSVAATSSLPLVYTWLQRQSDTSSWTEFSAGSNGKTSISGTMANDATVGAVFQIKCKISNGVKEVETNVAKLTVLIDDTITIGTQPISSLAVPGGETFTLSVEASSKVDIAYQWQMSLDGGSAWANISNGIQPTYSGLVDSTAVKGDVTLYRCQMTSGTVVEYTNTSTITCSKTLTISITKQPDSKSVYLGDEITLAIETDREKNDVNYSWTRLNKEGTSWVSLGVDSKSITVVPEESWGTPIRIKCKATIQGTSISAESEESTITVTNPEITITTQPVAPTAPVYVNSSVTMSVNATSELPLTYQWQYDYATVATRAATSGDNYHDISNGTGKSVTFAIDQTPPRTYKVRCKISNGRKTIYTNIISFDTECNPAITITKQPSKPTGTIYLGDNFSLSTTASSDLALTYQWQYWKEDFQSWGNSTNSTGTTNSLTTNEYTTASRLSSQIWRCKISNEKTTVYTSNVTLSITDPAITISTQPASSMTVKTGDSIQLSVVASSALTLSYQWQESSNGTSYTNISGATSSTYSGTAPSSATTKHFRCKISNAKKEVYSGTCTVTVESKIEPYLYISAPSSSKHNSIRIDINTRGMVLISQPILCFTWAREKGTVDWTLKSRDTLPAGTNSSFVTVNFNPYGSDSDMGKTFEIILTYNIDGESSTESNKITVELIKPT